jgi:hypothetical protein
MAANQFSNGSSLAAGQLQPECPVLFGSGAPEEIRTPDPRIRSLVLYSAELRALFVPPPGLASWRRNPCRDQRTSALAAGGGLFDGSQEPPRFFRILDGDLEGTAAALLVLDLGALDQVDRHEPAQVGQDLAVR